MRWVQDAGGGRSLVLRVRTTLRTLGKDEVNKVESGERLCIVGGVRTLVHIDWNAQCFCYWVRGLDAAVFVMPNSESVSTALAFLTADYR